MQDVWNAKFIKIKYLDSLRFAVFNFLTGYPSDDFYVDALNFKRDNLPTGFNFTLKTQNS